MTLPHGLEGFVPNSKLRQTDDEGNKVQFNEGETSTFKIIEYDRNNKKVILATPPRLNDETQAVAEYSRKNQSAPAASNSGSGAGGAMGDALRKAGLMSDDEE